MNKYTAAFVVMLVSLVTFLFFLIYQTMRMTVGGSISSSEALATLPLVVQADASLLAFWGLVLVFRISELIATRIELAKNLWDIGFKRDELRLRIEEAAEDKEKLIMTKLHKELGEDATVRKESIEAFYKWEEMQTTIGLLPAVFFVISVFTGLYGIGWAVRVEMIDPLTYFAPMVSLGVGTILTVFALFATTFRLERSLEIR